MKKAIKMVLFLTMVFVTALGMKTSTVHATGEENPRVYIEEYSISGDEIVAGEQFDLTLKIRNSSRYYDVYSVMVSFDDENEYIYPIYGDSNQYYINRIYARNNTQITIPMQAAEDISVDKIPLKISVTYTDNYFIEKQLNESEIFLPVRLTGDLKIVSSSVPSVVSVGAKARISLVYENVGSETLYNIALNVVSSSIEGGEMTTNLYNLSGGSRKTAEIYLDCDQVGKNQFSVCFTYEDEDGKKQETNKVVHNIKITEDTQNTGSQNVNILGGSVNVLTFVLLALIVIVTIAIVFIIKKNRR